MEKYTKVKNVGKGNMGACALARNNEDGRYYVIKQVDLTKLNKKERQQSLNEAKLLSSVRHPNVINYVDSFLARKSDHLCIVMEFADGGDLSNRVKNTHGNNFPQEQVLDWFIQIALALHHIHSRKILHRDVKTQNIFLTQEGVCKLGDFGIARTLSNTFDQANTFVGTPYYLSPELILERPYDGMSDVWALGVVLYEMLALKHPFNANDMKSLMHRILKVQYEAPPHVYTNDMRAIVGRLLVKDPAQRMRLSEVLELPIVVRRMQQWLQGGIVPSRYLASLIRHKLLPAAVTNSPLMGIELQQQQQQPGAAGTAAALAAPLPPVVPPPAVRGAAVAAAAAAAAAAAVAGSNGAGGYYGAGGDDDRVGRLMQAEHAAKQYRRDEIRHEFQELKGRPRPSPSPPPAYHVAAGHNGGAAVPMPQRDPSLLSHEPTVVRSAHANAIAAQRNLPAIGFGGGAGGGPPGMYGVAGALGQGGYGRGPPVVDALRADNLAMLPQLRPAAYGAVPGVARPPIASASVAGTGVGTGMGQTPAVRIQPSVRGLSGVAALPSHLQQPLGVPMASNYNAAAMGAGGGYQSAQQRSAAPPGPNANIQLMLERAAQQRMLNRPPVSRAY